LLIGLLGLAVVRPAYTDSQRCGDAMIKDLDLQQSGTMEQRKAADATVDTICRKANVEVKVAQGVVTAVAK
jgi:hypothetical protein